MKQTIIIICLVAWLAPLHAQNPVVAWNTVGDDFSAQPNRKEGGWFLSRMMGGTTSLHRAIDMQSAPLPLTIERSPNGRSVCCLTVSDQGEAYAVAYLMGNRQAFAAVHREIGRAHV